jgi:hypothetical protein
MKFIFALLAVGLTLVRGEPIELTRQQASDLFVALNRIEPGLSADNVVIAADNINALKGTVEALDKGKVRAQREMDLLPVTDDRAAKAWAIREKIEAKGEERVTVELTRIEVSADEIKAAKLRPADLAPLRQFLRPKR